MERSGMMHCRPGIVKSQCPNSPLQPADGTSDRKLLRQITPLWIQLLDKLEFPRSPPAFQARLSLARLRNGRVFLVINQHDNSMRLRETGHYLGFVLRNSPSEIIGDADIQYTAACI